MAGAAYAGPEVPLSLAYSVTGHYRFVNVGAGDLIDGAGTLSPGNISGNVNKAFLHWAGINLPHDNLFADSQVTLTQHGGGTFAPSNILANNNRPVDFPIPNQANQFYWDAVTTGYTTDVTSKIKTGNFQYDISDFDMDSESGAGLQILYEDPGAPEQQFAIYNGNDFAYRNWAGAGELNRTNVLTHNFEAASYDRVLHVDFFAANAASSARQDQLWFKTGSGVAPTELVNNATATVLDSNPLHGGDGQEWDTVRKNVVVPAGATYVSFQFQSGGGSGDPNLLPESFNWLSAAISLPVVQIPEPATMAVLGLGVLALAGRRAARGR